MHTRVTTVELDPEGIDAAIRQFKDDTLPEARQVPGFKGATVLVSREKGMMQTIAFWESREALESSAEKANRMRSDFVHKAQNARLVSVESFEVAVDEGEWMAKAA